MAIPVKFQGHSDDVFVAWSTHTNECIESTGAEYGSPCLFSIIAPNGEGLIVSSTYDFNSTQWINGIAPLTNSTVIPRWKVSIHSVKSKLYAPVLVVKVPHGSVVTDISSGDTLEIIQQFEAFTGMGLTSFHP